MPSLPFTEADEFRFKVSYQHNWISPTDHDPELDTPEHQIVMGGCDCCTTAKDAAKLTVVEYDELIEAGERALVMLRKLKQAATGYDEFGEDSEGKCADPECKCINPDPDEGGRCRDCCTICVSVAADNA